MGAAFGYIDAPVSEPQPRTQRRPSGVPSESALVVARLAAVHEAGNPDPSLPRPGRIAYACAPQSCARPEAQLSVLQWADETPDPMLTQQRAEGAAAAHLLSQGHGLVVLGHAEPAASAGTHPVPAPEATQRRMAASRPAAL